MKYLNALVLSFFLSSLSVLPVCAKTADDSAPAKPAPQMSEADKKKLKSLRERIEKARAGLNGSSWQVSYQPSDSKGKVVKDTFDFQDMVFKSKDLIDRGYSSTNYTVSMAGDDTELAIFETMLTSKDGVAFVRGEWLKEQMSGRIIEQLEGGKKVLEYSFTTSARKAIPPSSNRTDEKGEAALDGPKDSAPIQEGGALVSKESPAEVTPFVPGTTDESN
jgi:hypothetical protein